MTITYLETKLVTSSVVVAILLPNPFRSSQTFGQHELTTMGNSPSSGQGGPEAHDSRDIAGEEFKDRRATRIYEASRGDSEKSKISENERSNSNPLHFYRILL